MSQNNVVPALGAHRRAQEKQKGGQQQNHKEQHKSVQYVLEPMSKLDVDQDLWQVRQSNLKCMPSWIKLHGCGLSALLGCKKTCSCLCLHIDRVLGR